MDGKVTVEGALGAQFPGVECGQLIDRPTEEADLLVDRVTASRRKLTVVVVNAEKRRRLWPHRQLVAEPAVDGAVEARVDIGGSEGHWNPSGRVGLGASAGRSQDAFEEA